MKMKLELGPLAVLTMATLGGCTPQARQEYSAAGHEAAQAVKTDVQVSEKAAQAANAAAKKTVDESAKQHPATK